MTSGVRLGTAAVTSRGMNTEDMDVIAEAIAIVLKEEENASKTGKSSGERSDGEISADLKNRIKYPEGSCICGSLFDGKVKCEYRTFKL